MQRSYSQKLFCKILFSYITILLIPLLAMTAVYNASVASVTAASIDSAQVVLKQISKMTDTRLRELSAISYYLSANGSMTDLMTMDTIDFSGPDGYKVYKACYDLPRFNLVNNIIEDVDIILTNSNYIISPGSASRYSPVTHGYYYGHTGLDYDSMMHQVLAQNPSGGFFTFFGRDNPSVLYVDSIYVGNSWSPLAYLTIKLNPAFFAATAAQLDLAPEQLVFITDSDNRPLFSFAGSRAALTPLQVMEGLAENPQGRYREHLISMAESDYNGWRYYSVAPERIIMAPVSHLKNFILLLGLLSLGLGTALAYWLTKNKADALKRIIQYLESFPTEKKNKNEYEYIISGVNKLVETNASLQSLAQRQQPLMEAAVLRKLLFTSESLSPDTIDMFGKDTAALFARDYLVALVCLDWDSKASVRYSLSGLSLLGAALKDALTEAFSQQIFILDIDESSMAVLIPRGEEENFCAAADTALEGVALDMLNHFQLGAQFYISFIHQGTEQLSSAYSEALLVSEKSVRLSGVSVFHMADVPKNEDHFHYPIEKELKLIEFVKCGSGQELAKLLADLYRVNREERHLSASMEKQLVQAVRSSLVRGLQGYSQQPQAAACIVQLGTIDTMDELTSLALELNQALNQLKEDKLTDQAKLLKTAILEYINSNYGSDTLSLTQLSEHFRMSESSLYQFFREKVGSSFAELLESVRIQRACELLSTHTLAIKDIAAQVGYTNDHSFRRAFKRVLGITPGNYENITQSLSTTKTEALPPGEAPD